MHCTTSITFGLSSTLSHWLKTASRCLMDDRRPLNHPRSPLRWLCNFVNRAHGGIVGPALSFFFLAGDGPTDGPTAPLGGPAGPAGPLGGPAGPLAAFCTPPMAS